MYATNAEKNNTCTLYVYNMIRSLNSSFLYLYMGCIYMYSFPPALVHVHTCRYMYITCTYLHVQ